MESSKKNFYVPGLMDLSSYNFVRVDLNDDWNVFVEASPQGTIFTRSEFISGLQGRPGIWYCQKKNDVKAALAVMETENRNSTFDHNLMIYGGVLFCPHDPNQNYAQFLSEEFRISSAITEHLAQTYEDI